MQIMVFNGTADEFQRVSHLFNGGQSVVVSNPAQGAPSAPPAAAPATIHRSPTQEMLRKVITYRAIQASQKALLRALYRATDWMSASDLAKAMGTQRKGLTGIMGGFGIRCTSQRGWPRRDDTGVRPTRWLWEHERRDGEDYYKLTDEFREALSAVNLLN
ncbi:MAG: hypothetical protein JHD07_08820 [Bradyrhizobium sp.]|uniref:hypothetical protein n=1 Tax=Bradyrhizobium sp. TaxID=376 RepID=UPI001A2C79BB|nr:hypothetical protein [Bradyrhizobium sp.]MBJ7403380.1 hypothetical protein [Bradyrhizobium sp.]